VDVYSQFYNDYKDRLYAYLLRMTGDPQLAIDLVQESFTRYLGRYGKHDNNKFLLYTIARNAVMDVFRKKRWPELMLTIVNPLVRIRTGDNRSGRIQSHTGFDRPNGACGQRVGLLGGKWGSDLPGNRTHFEDQRIQRQGKGTPRS
jgi:hypothetical protein